MPSNNDNSPEAHSKSPSTAATTPEQLLDDDDIWGSDEHDESLSSIRPSHQEILSDLPTIKRQHMTDGYREGLAIGKAKVMQEGFDAGYPIGIQIALRVGLILGIIEGYLASKAINNAPDLKNSIQKTYEKAKEELSCSSLLKEINDEIIANATIIPSSIDCIISKWEKLVLGTKKNPEVLE